MRKLVVSLMILGLGQMAAAEYGNGNGNGNGLNRGRYPRQPYPGNPYPGQPNNPFPGQPGNPFPGFPGGNRPGMCLPHIQSSAIQLERSMQRFAMTVSQYERQGHTERAAYNALNEIRNFRMLVARTCCERTAREAVHRVHWALDQVERAFRSCHLAQIPQLGYAFQDTVITWTRLRDAVSR